MPLHIFTSVHCLFITNKGSLDLHNTEEHANWDSSGLCTWDFVCLPLKHWQLWQLIEAYVTWRCTEVRELVVWQSAVTDLLSDLLKTAHIWQWHRYCFQLASGTHSVRMAVILALVKFWNPVNGSVGDNDITYEDCGRSEKTKKFPLTARGSVSQKPQCRLDWPTCEILKWQPPWRR